MSHEYVICSLGSVKVKLGEMSQRGDDAHVVSLKFASGQKGWTSN